MKRIPAAIIALGLTTAAQWAPAQEVGYFFDKVEDCSIKHGSDRSSCYKGAGIQSGDTLATGKPLDRLPVQWLDRKALTFQRVDRETVKVTLTPPDGTRGVVNLALSFIGLVKKRGTLGVQTVTRGGASSECPPAAMALIPGMPVTFERAGMVRVTTSSGKTVFERKVAGQVKATPEEMGIADQGTTYPWSMDGNSCRGVFTLLSAERSAEVRKGLESIDADFALSEGDKALRKAAFLLVYQDLYPKEAAVGWLGAQILDEKAAAAEAADREAARLLRKRAVKR